MVCPNCSFENPDEARFCENCGQPLESACPNCGRPVPASARFCRHCGHNLAEAAPAPPSTVPRSEGLEAMRRSTPSAMARKILADRDRTEGERKRVTALFADLVGSTSLAESMDPEDWREIVAGAHQRISAHVYAFEGTIAQLLGDGVLAFFGAPLAHEDDPERALRAGLGMLREIRSYGDELAAAGRVPQFQLRVGVNTGLVVVGNIGSDLHMEYLAVGDTVNLAARVQSAAEPDTVLVTENTHRLTSTLFEFEDRGRITVKGKSGDIQVYRVVEERKGATRMRGIAGLDSPLVGRRREFAALTRVLADLRQGQGAAVAIVGEAGLGKSRLIAELRRLALDGDGPEILWVEGRCVSYGSTMAHHLSTDILRGLIGAEADASGLPVEAALRSTLEAAVGAQAAELYPYLAHLLGVELGEDDAARVKYLDGPALQARYIDSYTRLLRGLCARGPVVIVCEDLHWADPSSAELGRHVLPVVGEVPLVVALVTRPERDTTGWKLLETARETAGAGALEIHLAPLTETDTQDLVRNLLDSQSLPEALRDLIRSKAEGNPFFVEEVLRMLIDQGALQRDGEIWRLEGEVESLDIPDTLQGVLAARIDRLPEEAKRTLQVASVIGRTFPLRVLEEVLRQQKRSAP